ncbi:uncharacterized protein [Amphiura filiformis]|uniref:uncharacterized protein n=1 Tax=Amphiura filiformis TaxID=82378 RepID=UPI003B20E345
MEMTGSMPSKGIPVSDSSSTVSETTKMSRNERQKNHTDASNPSKDNITPGTSSSEQDWNHQCVENKNSTKEKSEKQGDDSKNMLRTPQVSAPVVGGGVEPNNNLNKTEISTLGRKLVSSQTLETIPENGNDEGDGCRSSNKSANNKKSSQDVKKEVKFSAEKKSSPVGQVKSQNKATVKKEKPPPPVRTFDTKSGCPPPVAKKPKCSTSGPTRFVSSKDLKKEQQECQKRTSSGGDGEEAVWVKQDSVTSVASTGSNLVRQDSSSSVGSSSIAPSITRQDSVTSTTSGAGPGIAKQDSVTSVASAVVRQDSTASVASAGVSVVSTASMGSLKELITGADESKEHIDVTTTDGKDNPGASVVTGNGITVSSGGGGNSPVESGQQETKPKKMEDQLVEINVDLLCEGYLQPCSSETMNCNSESQRLLAVDSGLPEALEDKWKPYFEKFDVAGDGNISMEAFQVILYKHGLKEEIDPHKMEVLESTIDENTGGTISYQEFVNIMSDKRTLSFSIAVRSRGGDYDTDSNFQLQPNPLPYRERFLKLISDEILTNDNDRRNFLSGFKWCLPPLFMLTLACLELGFYIGIGVNATKTTNVSTAQFLTSAEFLTGPVPKNSWIIFDPSKKLEFWRFITYIFIHGGKIEHLLFNIAVQIILGVPLEMIHGTQRTVVLYFSAVLTGSMGSSVLDRKAFLCGASAGTYALLSAHVANILLHFSDMKIGIVRIGVILGIVSIDFGLAVYRRYSGLRTATTYVAHLMGILMGLSLGIFILRNYDQRLHERLSMWIAMAIYVAFMIFVIFWNIFYQPDMPQKPATLNVT